jgi:hypothetical protein
MNEQNPTPAPETPPQGAPVPDPATVATAPAGTLQLLPVQPAPLPTHMAVLNIKIRATTLEEAQKIATKLPASLCENEEGGNIVYAWGEVIYSKTTELR